MSEKRVDGNKREENVSSSQGQLNKRVNARMHALNEWSTWLVDGLVDLTHVLVVVEVLRLTYRTSVTMMIIGDLSTREDLVACES